MNPIHWTPTTESKYFEMLGALPPEFMENNAFLLGEPHTHRACRITRRILPAFDGFDWSPSGCVTTSEAVTIPEFKALLAEKQNQPDIEKLAA